MNFSLGSFFRRYLLALLAVASYGSVSAQGDTLEIFEVEYFFDVDPGFGSATPITVGTPDSLVAAVETLNASSLSLGFHVLGFRARNLAPRPSFIVDDTLLISVKPTNFINPTLLSNSMWGITETRLVFVDQSESGVASLVDSLEYFFDEDPGVGSATIIDGFTAANQIALSSEVLVSDNLGFGFHVLGMRAKAVGNSWGTTETRLVFVDQSESGVASLVDSLEYFFDVDPGVGNATIIDGFTAANQIALGSEVLVSDTLAFGFHVLGMRAKAEGGSWGTTETRLVFVDQSESGVASLVDSLEYFFDVDPGVGSATIIDGFTTANQIALGSEVLVSDTLAFGFHVLGMRAKAEGGSWGTTETRLVFVDPSGSGTAINVDQIEYFFDEDPGVGSGTNVSAFTPDNLVAVNENIDASGLSVGFHLLGVRARAEGGDWGTTETRLVYVDADNTIGNIVALEYFVGNEDPGFGNATAIPVTTPGLEVAEVAELISDTLSIGTYQTMVRAQNVNGTWGISEFRPLVVGNVDGPVITSSETVATNENTIDVTVTFEEQVLSFTEADIEVSAGGLVQSASFVNVDSANYTFLLDLFTEGPVSVDIADSAAFTLDDNSPTPAAETFTIFYDVIAPNVTIDSLSTIELSPELTGTVDDDSASVSVTVAGLSYPASSVTGGIWTLNAGEISTLAAGVYDVEVTATDIAGNMGMDTTTNELEVIATELVALPASNVTATSFDANWTGGLDVQNYELDVSRDADFSTFLSGFDSLVINANTTAVTGLFFGTSYYYRVRVLNNSDELSENSEVVAVKTLIDSTTTADSLALVEIFAAVSPQGLNWDEASNARLRDWSNLTFNGDGTRVTGIDLNSTQAIGSLPTFSEQVITNNGLSELATFSATDNALTGLIDFANTSISSVAVENNSLTFEDLEPLVGTATFTYAPQAVRSFIPEADPNFLKDTELERLGIVRVVPRTQAYTLATGLNGAFNQYAWTLETEAIDGARFTLDSSALTIDSIAFDNMGLFGLSVTNTTLPDLTLNFNPENVFAVVDVSMRLTDFGDQLLDASERFRGALLETEVGESGYDTLARTPDLVGPEFVFEDVILGDYLCGIDPENRDEFVPTYFGDAFTWEEADTIEIRQAITLPIRMTEEPTGGEGDGTLDVVIEEDFGGDEEARVETRRRAKRRKCGLRRRRTGGRQDEFELFAYGETDDNGEFQFGFLPEGVYRFFVEYPGIPLDPDAEVQFEVGEQGISDTEFSLSAFASEGGVEIEIERILSIILTYFKDLEVYPNPLSDKLSIRYRHLKSANVTAEIVDLSGQTKWSKDLQNGYDGDLTIDVSDYAEGIYVLRFYDRNSRNENVVSYRIVKRNE